MADWNRIQGTTSQSPAGNTLTKAFAATVANGDVVVGAVLLNTGFTVTLTDDQSNAYTVFSSHDDGTLYTAAFVSAGFITNGPKTLTYTAHGTGTTANFWVVQDEFAPPSGAATLSVDGSASAFNTSGSSFPSFNTGLTDDLVYATAFSSGTSTHGSSFNQGSGDGTAVCSEWGIQTSAGAVTMNLATQTGSMWGPAFAINGGGAVVAQPSFPSVRYLGWWAALLLMFLLL